MYVRGMRLLVLARHGQSLLNVDGVVNGDPTLDRGLSPLGMDQARRLGEQIAGVAIDLCAVSAFPRAQETARLALERRNPVPWEVDPELNDIRIGELEGGTIAEYRAWKRVHRRDEPFPGGESLDESARRYADAYRRLLQHDAGTLLCICHEIPVRYAVNAAAGSGNLDAPLHDVPNATPYIFDKAALERAVERLARS